EDVQLHRGDVQPRLQDRSALQGPGPDHGVLARPRRATTVHRGGAGAVHRDAGEGQGGTGSLRRHHAARRARGRAGEGMRATVDRPGLDSQGRSPLIKIRRVRKGDLSKVRDVIEQAFGDFFERQVGTRPRQVFGGAQYVHHRWLMEPWGCFVAEEGDGKIVGAAVAGMWGTLGLVGPIAVLTNYQNQDIGQQLLAACQEFFDENKAALQGLVTYPNSPKHIMLYQKFGYRPKGLVMLAGKPLDRRGVVHGTPPPQPRVVVRRHSPPAEARKER